MEEWRHQALARTGAAGRSHAAGGIVTNANDRALPLLVMFPAKRHIKVNENMSKYRHSPITPNKQKLETTHTGRNSSIDKYIAVSVQWACQDWA